MGLAKTSIFEILKRRRLFYVTEVPKHLAFNSFIRTGYRCHLDITECLASLFYMHNETLNVYSHGIMAVFLCLGLPFYLTKTSSEYNILSIITFISCIIPFILSAIYHLFLCHRNGECVYDQLLCADLFGIAAVNCFGFVVPMWVTFSCHQGLRTFSMLIYGIASILILYYFTTAITAKQRTKPLSGFFIMRLIILALRMFYFGNINAGDTSAWRFYILMDIFGVSGALINIARIPERFSPGSFDYIFNSHQLMHVLSMCGIWCLNEGAHRDITWLMSMPEALSCDVTSSHISRL